MKAGVLQLPASVTPIVRFPLFWLAYHNLPASLYRKLALWTWKEDGYFLTYFHPWEFTSLSDRKELKLPFIMTNHSGCGMERSWTPSSVSSRIKERRSVPIRNSHKKS